jgi:hypothetical protein
MVPVYGLGVSAGQRRGVVGQWRSAISLTPLSRRRHWSALTKFAYVASRVCGLKQQGKVVFYASVNLCVRKHVRISVAVGLLDSGVLADQQLNESRKQCLASLADVVNKLEEAQVQREFLL